MFNVAENDFDLKQSFQVALQQVSQHYIYQAVFQLSFCYVVVGCLILERNSSNVTITQRKKKNHIQVDQQNPN